MKTKYSLDGSYRNERLYRIYHNMKSRCYLITFSRYEYYGGKGIKICNEWLNKENGFDNFYNWAMQNGYNDKLNINRIDKEKNYSPDNCVWVTVLKQNNSLRKNHYIKFNNQIKTVAEWAERFGIHRCVLNNRLRRGWKFEDAISIKTRIYSKEKDI